MYTVSVAEAKARLSELLNQVKAGEEIVITRRGRPVARLAAIQSSLKPIPLAELEAFRKSQLPAQTSSLEHLCALREEARY